MEAAITAARHDSRVDNSNVKKHFRLARAQIQNTPITAEKIFFFHTKLDEAKARAKRVEM